MKKSSEQISTVQLMFSVACFIQASTLLTYPIHGFAKQEAWICVLLGCLISLPIIWIYTSLAKRFPGKSLIEINDIVFGSIVGKIFSVLYIYFFLNLVFLSSRDIGNFVGGFLLPTTPLPAVLIMFLLVCCWAVRKGVKTMTSYAKLMVIIAFAVLLFNSLLLLNIMKFSNLLPIFSLPLKNYLEGSHTTAMLPMCELMAFLMLFPNLRNAKGSAKALWGGFAIGAITLFFNVARDTAVLGPYASLLTSPTFLVARLINVGTIFTRMEVLYAVTIIILMFFKTSVLLYAAVFGISQLLKLDSYKFLVPTFGAIAVIFAIAVFDSTMYESYIAMTGTASIYATFFELILPVITLTVAAVRGFSGKKEAVLL